MQGFVINETVDLRSMATALVNLRIRSHEVAINAGKGFGLTENLASRSLRDVIFVMASNPSANLSLQCQS